MSSQNFSLQVKSKNQTKITDKNQTKDRYFLYTKSNKTTPKNAQSNSIIKGTKSRGSKTREIKSRENKVSRDKAGKQSLRANTGEG